MADRAVEHVTAFVANCDEHRQQFLEPWREVTRNFMLQIEPRISRGTNTTPYGQPLYRSRRNQIMLKDPETAKVIWGFISKLFKMLFSERNGEYVQAQPSGFEDAGGANAVTRYLRYVFQYPGHNRSFVELLVNMGLHGSSFMSSHWRYEERTMRTRMVEYGMGVEYDQETIATIPVYDDVCLRPIDVEDFYYDPSRYRIEEMSGCAERFRMNAHVAKETPNFDQAAVARAIAKGPAVKPDQQRFREGIDQPTENVSMSDFKDMIGFDYWGWVPWTQDGMNWRRITLLNGEKVIDRPYPYADPYLPYHAAVINPVQGRLYGVSPAEIIRPDQGFADALKTLLAEAVIRMVHPPIAYDPDMENDPIQAKLREWKADVLIPVRGGPASIGAIQYNADLNAGWQMIGGLKASMQEAAGNQGISGEPGPDREAATVGSARVQLAMDRVEFAAQVLESDFLPCLGRGILRRGQQFLTSEGLAARIGQQPEPVWIGDLMGDYDIRFVGSRRAVSKPMKLQMLDRLQALTAAIPELRMQIPWAQVGTSVIGDWMELPEIAAGIGSPQTILMNTILGQMGGQAGSAGNGVAQASEPAGMLPAQAAGGMP